MDRNALRSLAEALPAGAAVPVPREWLLDLLGERPSGEATAVGPADPTVADLAERFGRSRSTVRWWIEAGRFPGAYRLRGREWRVPAAGVAAFESTERSGAAGPAPRPPGVSVVPRTRPATVDLGAWRGVRSG